MNRGKYVKDISYREGYNDGRREGVKTVIFSCNEYLDRIDESMKYLKERLNDIEKESEEM